MKSVTVNKLESMMKADTDPKPRFFGATPRQISEDDASQLVGGIVEKGFPHIPYSAPRPTVVAFPEARHRSHGPHWAPKAGNVKAVDDNGDMDEDVGEEDDSDGMVMAAGAAKPVERKEKKGMDFSGWQEMVKNDGNSVLSDKKIETGSNGFNVCRKAKEVDLDNLRRKLTDPVNSKLHRPSHVDYVNESLTPVDDDMVSTGREVKAGSEGVLEVHSLRHTSNGNIVQRRQESLTDIANYEESTITENMPIRLKGSRKEIQVDSKMLNCQKVLAFPSQKLMGGERENLESQIDAENRAQLAKMSSKEIEEAQAEIMAKLDPLLINALRRRGQLKVKWNKFSSSDITGDKADSMQPEKHLSQLTATPGGNISQKPVELASGDTQQDKDDGASTNISPENCSLWNDWSERVEHVRGIRFSLEGNIIDSELALVPDFGRTSFESRYNSDNVSERDFIRTEGDPGAAGYTITEAVALTRSVVPGQRTLALHLIATVLDRAIGSICPNLSDSSSKSADSEGADWEAIWAYALVPEPELALALRMCLDDNHNSVVLSSAKAIQYALSCDVNEIIFDMLEKIPTYSSDVCTAPVFRSKPDVGAGFLRGGFWKYNTKPSNIRCFGEELESEKAEGEHTIRDDIVVAGQDFAAGLVRMGILPRICYLLEADPAALLEECLISILIAMARHSPTSAAAILDCERLVQTVVNRFTSNEQIEINLSKIKSVRLLKVLARVDKKNCLTFINEGILQKVTWHLYRPFSLNRWVNSGREACKLSSALLVEQLRLWKVFVHYGYCIHEICDLFPSLCVWLSMPMLEKLMDNDVVREYCAITNETYLLLDALASRLPNFYSHMHKNAEDASQDEVSSSWAFLGSIVDEALEWVQVKVFPSVSEPFPCQINDGERNHILRDSEVNSLLWVISSVLNMLSSLLKAVIPDDIMSFPNGRLPWIPEFVTDLGLRIIKNGYFGFLARSDSTCNKHLEYSCLLRTKNRPDLALSSICCLQGLVRVAASVDELIRHANIEPSKLKNSSREDEVLANGILHTCSDEVRYLLNNLMKLITNQWQQMPVVESFSRGGPAPGVGAGWGASDGGYWSLNSFIAQEDARLLVYLLEASEIPFTEVGCSSDSDATRALNSVLTACLLVGPGDNRPVIDKLLKFIFRAPVFNYLDSSIQKFLSSRKGYPSYSCDECVSFADALVAHFTNRWLGVKKRKSKSMKKKIHSLETIYEETDGQSSVEWAHQRLPLPAHWFLSAISSPDFLKAARGGLFFLLGMETLSISIVTHVSVVWKLHAMSMALLSWMEILGDVFKILQDVYGEIVDERKCSLQFEKEIHESYATFVETLVEQFAAESYGDLLFGRQIAVYLHRSVEASTRLAAWNALSNARALELLPPVDKCFTKAEGFLEPVEDDKRILEAYVKSWVSGALDKAANRSSVTFLLALHHISSFIFGDVSGDMLTLRNKLVKSLVRDLSRNHQHEGMMSKLMGYMSPNTTVSSTKLLPEIERRLRLLREICDGRATEVEKLVSSLKESLTREQ